MPQPPSTPWPGLEDAVIGTLGGMRYYASLQDVNKPKGVAGVYKETPS